MIVPFKGGKEIRIPTKLEYVKKARDFIKEELARAEITKSLLVKIQLATDEAVTNAIDHGASNSGEGEIILSCEISKSLIRLIVQDFGGKPFDPEYFQRIAVVRDWGKGGRGILLINSIMDEVMFLIEENESTLVYMEKRIKEKEANTK